ncbi:sugar ABC transporter substrate-binding protein [Actinoplanes utahensis]|uniref:Sugar ABC transporter substrate-binding protein n=1 Tax=Actinoplanes utahensis TaxID=1869 RepID=A0A0A6UCE0_ACTUT|nr:substrate-binding domain-containing protein [Actinoplanes utahensis]KHD73715.1 sugar ABC transporter substrate-binding protein [Actinoplanes utahensis]GIF27934.1 sugar ABC transporter substrate-binding protein [Actinoplanes utahensis]
MRKGICALAAAGLLATGGVAACGRQKDGPGNGTKAQVGVILPDTRSSARWESADLKYLTEAFAAAGVTAEIKNAQGDKALFQTIADGMIQSGVEVLMIVNLDSGTGKNVLDNARKAGIRTIDYDRLTLNGGADYYVTFDNVEVGRLQGQGLVDCLTAAGVTKPVVSYLNGSPTDNNATQFKTGYHSVLQPRFDSGEYLQGPDQDVPEWDNARGGTIFEQQLTRNNRIAGVIAANDGVANAVIEVLKKNKLNGTVPVTGQDATVQGLQNILAGDQCMTVYKAIDKEAAAAAGLAAALVKGQTPTATGLITDPQTNQPVKSVLLQPVAVTRENMRTVVDDGYVTKAELCTGAFEKACAEAGIS